MTPQPTSPIARASARLLRTRWFVRTPVWLYRCRLGFIFGDRLLMLDHLGRTSGLVRHVVLEVIDEPRPGRQVVVSGFGDRAQWLRNIEANPCVRIHRRGRQAVPALARRLPPDAAARSITRYAGAHPRAWARLQPILEETLGTRVEERGTELLVVAIDVVGGS